MQTQDTDVITQFEKLSQIFEQVFNVKQELCHGHSIYLELIEVREKLAEIESTFRRLRVNSQVNSF